MTFWVAGAIVGSSVIGGISANKAANTQVAAADRAAQLQQQQFDKNIELQAPWREAGVNALGKLQSGDVMGQMDPGYQFRLSEGMKALDRTAASRGGLLSGATLKGAQRYGQGLASQEYGNAYNRLAAMAGIRQTATGAMTGLGSQFASNQGENYMGAANARASGYTGGANAVSGGLSQYLGYNQNQNLMNLFRPRLNNAMQGGGVQGMGQVNPMSGEYMSSLEF
jgi:hypothetical protein